MGLSPTPSHRRSVAGTAALLCSLWRLGSCKPTGFFLVGGGGGTPGVPGDGDPPVLAFGPEPADGDSDDDDASILALMPGNGGQPGALELVRGGITEVSFDGEATILPRTSSSQGFDAASWSVGGVQQWALWDLDTFDTDESGSWTANDRSFCGSSTDLFLGGPCRFGATNTMRRYENLPPHSQVRVSARVHYFDEWRGEALTMQVDGKIGWTQTHDWCPGFLSWMCVKFGMNTCGHETPDRISVKAQATMQHSGPVLDVAFSSNQPLGSDPCKASWGVDDVSIELL